MTFEDLIKHLLNEDIHKSFVLEGTKSEQTQLGLPNVVKIATNIDWNGLLKHLQSNSPSEGAFANLKPDQILNILKEMFAHVKNHKNIDEKGRTAIFNVLNLSGQDRTGILNNNILAGPLKKALEKYAAEYGINRSEFSIVNKLLTNARKIKSLLLSANNEINWLIPFHDEETELGDASEYEGETSSENLPAEIADESVIKNRDEYAVTRKPGSDIFRNFVEKFYRANTSRNLDYTSAANDFARAVKRSGVMATGDSLFGKDIKEILFDEVGPKLYDAALQYFTQGSNPLFMIKSEYDKTQSDEGMSDLPGSGADFDNEYSVVK